MVSLLGLKKKIGTPSHYVIKLFSTSYLVMLVIKNKDCLVHGNTAHHKSCFPQPFQDQLWEAFMMVGILLLFFFFFFFSFTALQQEVFLVFSVLELTPLFAKSKLWLRNSTTKSI